VESDGTDPEDVRPAAVDPPSGASSLELMTKSNGQPRRMTTRWTVRAADHLANWVIAVGGVGTIVAVSGVFVFLVFVVVPLFLPGSAREQDRVKAPGATMPLHMAVDEYRVAGWTLSPDGVVHVFRLDTGAEVSRHPFVHADSVSAWSWNASDGSVELGYVDGTVRSGKIRFVTDFPTEGDLPAAARALGPDDRMTVGEGVVELTRAGKFRRQRLALELGPPVEVTGGVRIERIDHTGGGKLVALIDARGTLRMERVEQTENLLTGAVETRLTGGQVSTPYARRPTGPGEPGNGRNDRDAADNGAPGNGQPGNGPPGDGSPGDGRGRDGGIKRGPPDRLLVTPAGTAVWLVWRDGKVICYDTRNIKSPRAIGESSVDVSQGITALTTLLGGTTLLAGDGSGMVHGLFRYHPKGVPRNTFHLARAHRYAGRGAPVTVIAPSARSRIFAVGYRDGHVRLFQGTSGARIVDLDAGAPVRALAIAPKDNGLVVRTDSSIAVYRIDIGYPEATLGALFRPVWYEGYAKPSTVWQSSGGTDDFEAKLGMWPLVFGTLKATFYSMLFAIPLALLAAVYTSEFMKGPMRLRIKTLIESMASLPSVVLGFLAALVIAPFVQADLGPVLAAFFVVPTAVLIGGYVWQLLPQQLALAFERWRLVAILAAVAISIPVAVLVGNAMDQFMFGGNIITWLDGQQGSGLGGWMFLLLPVSVAAVVLAFGRIGGARMRALAARSTRRQAALTDMARFALGAIVALAVAALCGLFLDALGIDPRGAKMLMNTYVQRNALIVGFIMGFAVIPIIYTIAEDALTAVPDHLRAASLGAGATPWQTAVRIVLPTAMSGLFSAIMIGLGRAVGETMIVLMAAGNTPILEMNMFNGFRTLSANIAVELPEAVRNSTHYRTLFLSALLLFVMTFVLNSIAEVVRLRFRRRSSQI